VDEWCEIGQELLELNPPVYRKMLGLMRELVEAQRKVAAPDLRVYLELLRIRLKETA
jgi:hypothetical protein